MSTVPPIPEGCHSVNVYLIVRNCHEAIQFYSKALNAELATQMDGPDGSIMHAELKIGDSTIMLSDENPAWGMKSPLTLGGSPASMMVYCEDADGQFDQAVEAGCDVVAPLADMFWGDRFGKVKDPFGHEWGIATHIEDVAPDDMARRQQEFMAQMAQQGSDSSTAPSEPQAAIE
jgi:PhnB protein